MAVSLKVNGAMIAEVEVGKRIRDLPFHPGRVKAALG